MLTEELSLGIWRGWAGRGSLSLLKPEMILQTAHQGRVGKCRDEFLTALTSKILSLAGDAPYLPFLLISLLSALLSIFFVRAAFSSKTLVLVPLSREKSTPLTPLAAQQSSPLF